MLQTIADMRLDWLKYQYIGEFLKAKFRFLETEAHTVAIWTFTFHKKQAVCVVNL